MYTKKTLDDLKQSLADRHDGGVLPTDSATLAFWTRLLNRGQAYCADKLRLIKSKSYTTSSGTIALDSDFLVIENVVNADKVPLTQISELDSGSASGSVFWITGNHDSGYFLNTPEDATYTAYYSFRPSDMTGTDECIIPDPEAVVAYAYSFLRKSETDPIEDADKALEECDNRLAELQSAKTINDNFEGITLSI